MRIDPIPAEQYLTSIEHGRPEIYRFDFVGIILPPSSWYELRDQRQFVFDRSAGGKLVRFYKLPKRFNLPADESYETDPERWGDVIFHAGGYTRELGAATAYTLLLNIIRLRWFPDLTAHDDYGIFGSVESDLWKSGLARVVQNANLDFSECWRLYLEEDTKLHPKRRELAEEPVPHVRVVPPNPELLRIDDLDVSVRLRSVLRTAQITTVGELIAYREVDLWPLKNMGSKSMSEIMETLEELGLRLRRGEPEISQ